jgi:cytochrome c551/c552
VGLIVAFGVGLAGSFAAGWGAGRFLADRLPDDGPRSAAAKPGPRPGPSPSPTSNRTPERPPARPAAAESAESAGPAEPARPGPAVPPKREEPPAAVAPPKPPPAPPPSAPARLTFAADVRAIFQAKCVSCHGGQSKKGGLDVRTLAAITEGGNKGPALVPGDPARSPVWTTIEMGKMPPRNKPQLTADEKELVRRWIAGGAK